jgi:hypothetical protein
MIHNRYFADHRPTLLFIAALVLTGIIALAAVDLDHRTASSTVAGQAAAPSIANAQGAEEAWSARLEGQAHRYAAVNAYAARWQGLAEYELARQRTVPGYRAPTNECFDVPLSEAANCQAQSSASRVQPLQAPLGVCFDVPLSELDGCRSQEAISASQVQQSQAPLGVCFDVPLSEECDQ